MFGESALFAAIRFRCPLTELAQSLGADSGSVTDLYLPKRFAHNLPVIHAPLLVFIVFLHDGTCFGIERIVERNSPPSGVADPGSPDASPGACLSLSC